MNRNNFFRSRRTAKKAARKPQKETRDDVEYPFPGEPVEIVGGDYKHRFGQIYVGEEYGTTETPLSVRVTIVRKNAPFENEVHMLRKTSVARVEANWLPDKDTKMPYPELLSKFLQHTPTNTKSQDGLSKDARANVKTQFDTVSALSEELLSFYGNFEELKEHQNEIDKILSEEGLSSDPRSVLNELKFIAGKNAQAVKRVRNVVDGIEGDLANVESMIERMLDLLHHLENRMDLGNI